MSKHRTSSKLEVNTEHGLQSAQIDHNSGLDIEQTSKWARWQLAQLAASVIRAQKTWSIDTNKSAVVNSHTKTSTDLDGKHERARAQIIENANSPRRCHRDGCEGKGVMAAKHTNSPQSSLGSSRKVHAVLGTRRRIAGARKRKQTRTEKRPIERERARLIERTQVSVGE